MLVVLLWAQGGLRKALPIRSLESHSDSSVTGPIPVTADSRPFLEGASFGPVDLTAHGYVEEEFFVSGTGNV
jgi:hypothetical protein